MHRRWAAIGGVAVLVVVAVLVAMLPARLAALTHPEPVAAPSPAPVRPVPAADGLRPDWFRMSQVVHERLATDRRNFAVRTRADGPLLLLLPATNQYPAHYSRFLRLAQQRGYHVLGLDYWNLGRSVASTCGTDAGCYGAVQRNRFDGTHPFDRSRVAPRDSVLGRLVPALRYLAARDPHGGWGRYLAGDRVRWPRIVLAGHSQGGGESAWIAHTRAVRGALLFGSPIVTDGAVAASWLRTPSRTPASRVWAFDDTSDVYWPRIAGSWRLMGLGAPTDVTGPQAGWGHALISTEPQSRAHSWVLEDSTPLGQDGEPRWLPVWGWMLDRCGPAPASSGTARA